MAIEALNGGRGLITIPDWPFPMNLSSSFTLSSMSAAAHRKALSFVAPKAGDIAKVHFRTGTVTTGDDLHISLQDQDSDGNPDGTEDQYRVLTVGDGDDNAWLSTGIISSDGTDGGTKRTVAAGDRLSVVFRFNSYVAGSLWLQYIASASYNGLSAFLGSTNSGSTWAQALGAMAIAIEYADGTFAYIDNTVPFSSISNTSVGSGSTPDEYSLRLRLPFPVRVMGLMVRGASADTEIGLYPDSGAALATGVPQPANTSGSIIRKILFSSAVDLLANTYYRISWKPTTATVRTITVYSMASAGIRGAFSLGTNFALGTRADGGSWTDDETQMIMASLLVSGIDDGAGGGGGSCSYGALSNGTRVVPVAQ